MSMIHVAFFAVLLAGSTPVEDIIDISYGDKGLEDRQALQFKVSDVLLVEVVHGPRAVIQFTDMKAGRGKYRWRYWPDRSKAPLAGVGEVAEVHERISDGDGVRLLPLPGNDTIIRAGRLRAEWSTHDRTSAFIYFVPSRATVTILPGSAFELSR